MISKVDEHFQTNVAGIFSAGNVLHVHDMVDFVTLEAENLARGVTEYIKNGNLEDCRIQVKGDGKIGGIIPQKISGMKDVTLLMRVRKPVQNCYLEVRQQEHIVIKKKIIHAIPAEMMQIKLKKSGFRNLYCRRSWERDEKGGIRWWKKIYLHYVSKRMCD